MGGSGAGVDLDPLKAGEDGQALDLYAETPPADAQVGASPLDGRKCQERVPARQSNGRDAEGVAKGP